VTEPIRPEPIHLEVRDGLAWITLDDGRANAIGRAFCEQLGGCLDRIEADPDAFAVVLRGRPGFFSGGLDLKELPDLPPAALAEMIALFMATMRRLFLFAKPIVAAADGHAIAGGMMLYLCADLRLAVDRRDARFGLNEAVTGIPLLGGTAGICRHGIPPQYHTELILHGRMIDARGTAERGITHELTRDARRLSERAEARARALADLSLPAYRLNKRVLREDAWDAAVAMAERLADDVPTDNVFERLRR
jgi:enoyl-CoA hydratase